ncbi:hypothetical protein Cylst_4293 [Cylindrospermum stagnale PCC 7417]|uniref:Uncharacterized protein n=1 Tax=Cylindrospermum stagnale PCC 7417 TaxID=56107 RepID=K9X2S9_9NOST|nr:hypothetical protein Cylst_4293 [Cylindrospermum stagnale PCC 7417]
MIKVTLNKLSEKTICNDCAFYVEVKGSTECIHPDEFEVNCSTVTFCSSFLPAVEVDSPCVTFDIMENIHL